MRCISNLDYLHLGIKVSGRTDTTRLQLRGHAQSEPHLCWRGKNTMFGSINGVLGGAIIFRCDVEVEDDLRLALKSRKYSARGAGGSKTSNLTAFPAFWHFFYFN